MRHANQLNPDSLLLHLDNNLENLTGTCAEHLFSIEIDIAIGPNERLYERFEWDLSNPDNSPEEFSACLVSDYLHEQEEPK